MKNDLHSRPALWATLTLAAVFAASSAVAIANAEGSLKAHPDKAKACNSTSPCIKETNNSSGMGIEGIASSGVGIEGTSSSNAGVFGLSSTYYGVLGESSGIDAAVGGYNSDSSSGASGVYGQSQNGFGVTGYAANGYAMFAEGDVLVTGEVYTAGSCHSGCSKTRQQASFVSRSSQPTIDDVGESALRDGAAHVALAADFANAIDTHKSYVVLLTPEGDAPLYVTNRNATGFEVRQMGGGHSSVQFAYRIVAKPFAVADERLPFKATKDFSASAPR